MIREHVISWVQAHPLSAIHVDCSTTVMLKILDGKCKMRAEEKQVMEMLYDQVKNQAGHLLDASLHSVIALARNNPEDEMKNQIYEKRLLAETAISRPVMKNFKAMIRQQGLLAVMPDEEDES